MIDFTITLTGTAPLLMHSSRLSDPIHPATKAVAKYTKKQKKTEEDHEIIGRLEFEGGMYHDDDIGPYIPGENINRCLIDAAKLTRQGTAVIRGLLITTDINPLAYNGPRDVEGLWSQGWVHRASVRNKTNRVMRTRPWFPEWAVAAEGRLDPSVLTLDDLAAIADNAGLFIGLGDWRPRFGRFTATVEQTKAAAA